MQTQRHIETSALILAPKIITDTQTDPIRTLVFTLYYIFTDTQTDLKIH